MIYKLSKYFTDYLDRKKIIDNETREIYLYGFDITLASIFNVIIVITFAFLFKRPLDAIVYSLCTIPLRKYSGGWHAKTHLLCITLHSITFSLVSWFCFMVWMSISLELVCIISILSLIIVFLKAPVDHYDNPLSDEMRSINRKKSILFTAMFFIISIAVYLLVSEKLSVLITVSSFSAIATLLIPNKNKAV